MSGTMSVFDEHYNSIVMNQSERYLCIIWKIRRIKIIFASFVQIVSKKVVVEWSKLVIVHIFQTLCVIVYTKLPDKCLPSIGPLSTSSRNSTIPHSSIWLARSPLFLFIRHFSAWADSLIRAEFTTRTPVPSHFISYLADSSSIS